MEPKGRTDIEIYTTGLYKVLDARTFNFIESLNTEKKTYLLQFELKSIRYIGLEVVINNRFYKKRSTDIIGMSIWYIDNIEVGRNRFIFNLRKEWKVAAFIQNWGTHSEGFWDRGQGKVEIYLEEEKILTRYFTIGIDQIIDTGTQEVTYMPVTTTSGSMEYDPNEPAGLIDTEVRHGKIDEAVLQKSLEELNRLTGLVSVKDEINEIVKLARFFNEQGEPTSDKFNAHFVFLGNPGTGKTTVARIFSSIYKALGILPAGHFVETDRQGLVGVYIGQTAQKTMEQINKADGGILFIDEAYSLSNKGSSSNDFGIEAVETLLKRMEDNRGKFIVIAAGYTDEMNAFLKSNPGLNSRFSRKIFFEDYSPDELLEITINLINGSGHQLQQEAETRLLKYYTKIFRDRDKNFGNARVVRDLVDRILKTHLLRMADLSAAERTEPILKEISEKDLLPAISKGRSGTSYKIQGDSELLDEYLIELGELTGLESVKNSVRKLIGSLKVAKLREERGLKVLPKNLHSVFTGNPGTGKTHLARLLSKIYKEMGIIEKGHLVEVDRSGLVAGYQGQTAIKTDAVIQNSLGGTLFIDEAYSLARGDNDFGLESIDTLIKRMEDYKGKFVVIVAGYTVEMKEFLEANPGLKSRFTNYYHFEDYTPRQLLEIAFRITKINGYNLDEGAWQLLLDICTQCYTNRDRNFGNARMIQNILSKAIGNQEERILRMQNPNTDDLNMLVLEDFVNIDLTGLQ